MATLKATIKIETTTLFPNPINFTVPVVEQVALDAGFSTVVIEPATTEKIYSPAVVGASDVTYIFLQANGSNTDYISVEIVDSASAALVAIKLLAGDFAWFPLLADSTNCEINVSHSSVGDDQTLYYIFAERG